MPERDPKDQARRLRQLADELDPPDPRARLWIADTKLTATLLAIIEQVGPNAVALALVEALREAK